MYNEIQICTYLVSRHGSLKVYKTCIDFEPLQLLFNGNFFVTFSELNPSMRTRILIATQSTDSLKKTRKKLLYFEWLQCFLIRCLIGCILLILS